MTTALMLGASPSMASAEASPDGKFQLLLRGRWCLEGNNLGYRVSFDDCESFDATWQQWRLQGDDWSKMQFRNVADDGCLTDDNEYSAITETCSDSTAQQWKVTTDVGEGGIQLQNVATGRCFARDADCDTTPRPLKIARTSF
ncbi:RICIN domain-containing protein [Streptomyces sp. NPDC008163]|uniref:RICIN domain-containing protein n=1 Tax=Streptomyces sp. NPDC008163 TaxID=3364818 RepID=UPI0036E5DE1F